MLRRPFLSAPVTVVVTLRRRSSSGPRSATTWGRNVSARGESCARKRTVRVRGTVRPALLSRVATRPDVRVPGPDVTEGWRTRLYGACKQLRDFAAEKAEQTGRASGSHPKVRVN